MVEQKAARHDVVGLWRAIIARPDQIRPDLLYPSLPLPTVRVNPPQEDAFLVGKVPGLGLEEHLRLHGGVVDAVVFVVFGGWGGRGW